MIVEREGRREGRWLDKGLALDPPGDFLHWKWAGRWRALVVRRELKRSSPVFLLPMHRRAPRKMLKSPMKHRKGPKARLFDQVWFWVSSLGAQARSCSRKLLARSSRPSTNKEPVATSSPRLVFSSPDLALLAWTFPASWVTARTCLVSSFSTVIPVTSSSWGCSDGDI